MFTMPKAVNHFFNLRLMFPADSFNYFRNLTQTIVEQRKSGKSNGSSKVVVQNKRNDLVQLLIDSYVYEDELKGGGYDKLTATMEEGELDKKVMMAFELNLFFVLSTETNTSAPSESNGNAEKNNNKKTLNDLEIIAQCMIFFVAGKKLNIFCLKIFLNFFYFLNLLGFETTATVMQFDQHF